MEILFKPTPLISPDAIDIDALDGSEVKAFQTEDLRDYEREKSRRASRTVTFKEVVATEDDDGISQKKYIDESLGVLQKSHDRISFLVVAGVYILPFNQLSERANWDANARFKNFRRILDGPALAAWEQVLKKRKSYRDEEKRTEKTFKKALGKWFHVYFQHSSLGQCFFKEFLGGHYKKPIRSTVQEWYDAVEMLCDLFQQFLPKDEEPPSPTKCTIALYQSYPDAYLESFRRFRPGKKVRAKDWVASFKNIERNEQADGKLVSAPADRRTTSRRSMKKPRRDESRHSDSGRSRQSTSQPWEKKQKSNDGGFQRNQAGKGFDGRHSERKTRFVDDKNRWSKSGPRDGQRDRDRQARRQGDSRGSRDRQGRAQNDAGRGRDKSERFSRGGNGKQRGDGHRKPARELEAYVNEPESSEDESIETMDEEPDDRSNGSASDGHSHGSDRSHVSDDAFMAVEQDGIEETLEEEVEKLMAEDDAIAASGADGYSGMDDDTSPAPVFNLESSSLFESKSIDSHRGYRSE